MARIHVSTTPFLLTALLVAAGATACTVGGSGSTDELASGDPAGDEEGGADDGGDQADPCGCEAMFEECIAQGGTEQECAAAADECAAGCADTGDCGDGEQPPGGTCEACDPALDECLAGVEEGSAEEEQCWTDYDACWAACEEEGGGGGDEGGGGADEEACWTAYDECEANADSEEAATECETALDGCLSQLGEGQP